MQSEDFLNGQIILIDKPLEWTSFDVVNKLRNGIRRTFGIKKIKVGHAGTLDPMATGLLIICTGKFTKRINEFMGQEKEYTGIIRLGATTPTYDLESEPDQSYPTEHINAALIEKTIPGFIGSIQQVPPVFSAIKKGGQRAYELARRGDDVKLQSREVQISELEITGREGNDLHFRVSCSKGTYIRSLAHDFGKALESGAHLAQLRRTRIGEFSVQDALGPVEYLETVQAES